MSGDFPSWAAPFSSLETVALHCQPALPGNPLSTPFNMVSLLLCRWPLTSARWEMNMSFMKGTALPTPLTALPPPLRRWWCWRARYSQQCNNHVLRMPWLQPAESKRNLNGEMYCSIADLQNSQWWISRKFIFQLLLAYNISFRCIT